MFSKRYGQQQGQPQSGLPKRSNRVFILQYSPQRSKSKKQNKAQQIARNSQKPFKATIQNCLNNLNEVSPVPSSNTNHRSNIDRLVNLISKSRSQQRTESESGCQKLVKVLQKIIKSNKGLAFFMEKLKKYTMLCSSTNYQLFIQSRHTQFPMKEVQKKGYDKIEKQLLQKINESSHYQDFSHSNHSMHFNDKDQYSPKLSPRINRKAEPYEDITFKRMDIASPLKFNQSLLQSQQSPFKGLQSFKMMSKEYIPTAQTLKSQQDLNFQLNEIPCKASKILLYLNKKQKLALNLLESPLLSKIKKGAEMQFLHLCHQKRDILPININDNIADDCNQQLIFIQQIKSKSISALPIFPKSGSRTKLDFALPTQMIAEKNTQIKQQNNIQITFEPKNIDSSKQTPSKLRKKNEVLNAKQIADRMLFGEQRKMEAPRRVQTKLKIQDPPARKRISSLPKITFTYSSREKDEKILQAAPSVKRIQSPSFQKQSAVISNTRQSNTGLIRILSNNQIKINKQDLQSTFGSTQQPRNILINQHPENPRSPKIRQNIHKPMIVSQKQGQTKQIFANQYYTPIASPRLPPLTAKDLFNRQRIISQQHYGDDIQYVGIQDEPRCCLIKKETRSKSLNQFMLNKFPQRAVF